MKLVTNNYEINSNKIKKSIRLFHFTDVHYTEFTKDKVLSSLINAIENYKPDYVVFTGDMIDSPKRIDDISVNKLLNFIKSITKTYKLIYVSGNHEIKDNEHLYYDLKPFFKELKKLENLYYLDGAVKSKIEFDDVCFYGFDLDYEYYYENNENNKVTIQNKINRITRTMDKEKYNVLLCHTPSIVDDTAYFKDKAFDLILCGHMHNGLIPHYLNCKNQTFGLISPRRKLFPKYSRNLFTIGKTHIIIGYPVCFNYKVEKYNLNFIFKPGINTINIKNI